MEKEFIVALFVFVISITLSSVQAYTNEQYGFMVDPPGEWTVDDTDPRAVVIFYGPWDEGFMTNVNIQVEFTKATLQQYISAGKITLQNSLADYKLESESTRIVSNIDAYELVYNFTDSGICIKIKQVFLIKYEKAFVITCAALSTTYQRYLPDFESSLATFKIIEQVPWYITHWYIWLVVAVIVVTPLALYLKRKRANTKARG